MSRVFLSYSRIDEDFATRLRKRLETEAPDVSLWQDRTRMEGGIGWWQQIKDALDQVEFMVLVMSEATHHSETVRKEWRYARQQGVCVYPVKASEFDFSELPRWMSSVHFFDIEKEWPTFLQHLRSPAYSPRVPFMAPDLPANFVSRPVEFANVRDHLIEHGHGNSIAITTALHGAGGFGKTTLAAALCHDEDVITAFFDGILWVTLGRNPNLQTVVTLMHNALTGEHTAFPDVQSAGLSLAEQLQDRTCLMVIDDVWDASNLQPFLRGGPNCARLITTRDFRIAADFVQVQVDEMRGTEATQLLSRGLPTVDRQPFEETARRLGEWPLLLELANATLRHRIARGDTLDGALQYLNRSLDRRGITRFDPLNEAKIARTIEISLESLHEGRQHCYELAVFPENTSTPVTALQSLWGLDDFDTEELVQSMHDLSLLHFDLQAGTFRLHDAIRAWLREQLPDLELLHLKLSASWGNPRVLPNAYAWRWIGYHLVQAQQTSSLRSLLLDFDWLQSKLEATDVQALIVDCEYLGKDQEISRLLAAIRLSAHVLSRDKTQFAGQLLGRLPSGSGTALTALLEQAAQWNGATWLRPLNPSLTQVGGPLIRTIIVGDPSNAPLMLNPNGLTAFCVAENGAINEWNLKSGTQARSLNLQSGPVSAFSLIDPGRAVSATDKTIRLWDLDLGTELLTLSGHLGAVTSLAVTADGQHIVSASVDGTIRMWSLESGAEICCISAHADRVSTVCLLPDGTALSGSRDGKLRLWDLESRKKRKSFLARGRVASAAVTPDGRWVVAGLSDGTLKIWSVESGDEVCSLAGHTDHIGAIAITPDGHRAISASWDGTLRVWDFVSGSELCCFTGHTDRVSSVAVSADGSHAVSLSHDGTLKLWDLKQSASTVPRAGHNDSVVAIAANPKREQALSASLDGTIRIWDLDSHAEMRRLCSGESNLSAIAISPDGRRAISGSRNRTVKLWDIDTGELLRCFLGHTSEVSAVAFTPDGRCVLSASEDRSVRVWDIESGTEIRRFLPHTRSVTAMAVGEGRVFSGAWDSGSWDGALKLWNLESGVEICCFSGLADSVSSVDVTRDFSRGISGCWDGTAKVWDLQCSSEISSYTGHADTITTVTLTPDGRHAASTSRDQTLHVWEIATGRVLAKFTGDGPLTACAVIGEGPTLIVGEASGVIHFLRLESHAREAADSNQAARA